MDHMERTPSRTYGYPSNPPPVAPRRDTKTLPLRRYHSSNPDYGDHSRSVSVRTYESEYDKLNSYIRQSIATRQRTRDRTAEENPDKAGERRQRAQTNIAPVTINNQNDDDEDLYLSASEIATAPSTSNPAGINRTPSPIPMSNGPSFKPESAPQTQVRYAAKPKLKRSEFQVETAIYGVAQGKGPNIVMQLKELQQSANALYRSITNTNQESPGIADLKTHLRIGDKAPMSEILRHVHQSLLPPELSHESQKEYTEIYLVDFNCTDKVILRDKILNLFTMPGPPSVAYQRVNAKLDALINNFADTVIKMRLIKNETLLSPYHAQIILQGQDADQLLRVLQNNELWIRWGTESGLPPLQHIYMFKHPPTYEMRKAITLSLIAARQDIIKMLFTNQTRVEMLIPPIYGKLESGEDSKWQVTEYDPETKKFESRECVLPAWIEECGKLAAHLKSGNRSAFRRGEHIYALYSVYIIVVKDITLTENSVKEGKMPCSHQIYVGSSSTGVLYRFMNVAHNHCDRMKNVLDKAPKLESYRCFQESELVETCLILSWIRRQPRAVFVINSFQEGDMTNLSLNKKKPFYEKMANLQQHYINSKKLGPLHDMRFGMNCTGDAT